MSIEAFKQLLSSLVQNWGELGLFIFSALESFIQPFPVDPFLIGSVAFGMNPHLALITATLGSITGGAIGYLLGKNLGEPVFLKLFNKKYFKLGHEFFEKWGVWAVLIASVSPIPYKLMAWLSGIFEMNFFHFIIMTSIGRVIRFMIVTYGTIIIMFLAS